MGSSNAGGKERRGIWRFLETGKRTSAAGSNSFSPAHRLVRADAKAVRPFKITVAKVRLAMAGKRSTAASRQMGRCARMGLQVIEGGKIRYGKKK